MLKFKYIQNTIKCFNQKNLMIFKQFLHNITFSVQRPDIDGHSLKISENKERCLFFCQTSCPKKVALYNSIANKKNSVFFTKLRRSGCYFFIVPRDLKQSSLSIHFIFMECVCKQTRVLVYEISEILINPISIL